MTDGPRWHEDWSFKIRGRDVAVRVALDGPGRGTLTGFHVVYGPSQLGLQVSVTSQKDAQDKVEALLCELMGAGWY